MNGWEIRKFNITSTTNTGVKILFSTFFSWGILFSHPADFTPVCTTELARLLVLHPEFVKRNVKIAAVSCDSVESHKKWIDDIKLYSNTCINNDFPYPIIADEERDLATKLQMLDPDEKDAIGIPVSARAVFIIDPKKKMRLSILYPANVGRNFEYVFVQYNLNFFLNKIIFVVKYYVWLMPYS